MTSKEYHQRQKKHPSRCFFNGELERTRTSDLFDVNEAL